MTNVNFDWVAFYSELATKLLDYQNDRKTLIEKLQNVFKKAEMKFPTMEKNHRPPTDIDPFTFFATFNKASNNLTELNRVKIIELISEEFDIQAVIPHTFSGTPVVTNLSATFFAPESERQPNDIQNLWELFVVALKLVDQANGQNRQDFIRYFENASMQKNVKWKVTMGLCWVRPYAYLNLDSRNRWFIDEVSGLPEDFKGKIRQMKDVPSGEEYLNLCGECQEGLNQNDCPYKNFPELSSCAWETSEKVNKLKKIKVLPHVCG